MFHNYLPMVPLTVTGALFFRNKISAYGLPVVLVLIKILLSEPSWVWMFIGAGLFVSVALVQKLKTVWGASLQAAAGYAILSVVSYELFANLGVWFAGGACTGGEALYASTFAGLIECYRASLPYSAIHFMRDVPMSILCVAGISLAQKYAPSFLLHYRRN